MNATGGISRIDSSIAFPTSSGSARTGSSWPGAQQEQRPCSGPSTRPSRSRRTGSRAAGRRSRRRRSPRAGSFATADVIEPSGSRRTRASSAMQDRVERVARGVGAALRLRVAVVDHRAGERLVEPWIRGHVVEREAEDVAGDADRERAPRTRSRARSAARGEARRAARRCGPRDRLSKRSRTGRMRNGSSNGARWRACSAPSLVSIITPSDARTRFGSAQHGEVASRGPSSSRASA